MHSETDATFVPTATVGSHIRFTSTKHLEKERRGKREEEFNKEVRRLDLGGADRTAPLHVVFFVLNAAALLWQGVGTTSQSAQRGALQYKTAEPSLGSISVQHAVLSSPLNMILSSKRLKVK